MKTFNILSIMRKIFRVLAYAAVLTASFTACNKELDVVTPNEAKEYVYTFNLGDDSAFTKAVLDNDETASYIKWTAGDQLGSITTNTQGYSDITPATNEAPAQFKIKSKDGLEAGNTINVWFPFLSTQTNPEGVSFEIAKEQTLRVSDNKFNFRNMPMVAKQVTVTAGMASATDETAIATINMANLGSVILFKVYSTDAGRAEEKVRSITFNAKTSDNSAPADIAGSFSKNLVTIDPDNEETMGITFTTGYSSVRTSLITPSAIGADKAHALDVYMVVAPGSYRGTIVVKTDAAEYTYELSSAKTLNRSGIKAFGLDLNSATLVAREDPAPETVSWVKTDITALKEGDVIAIVDVASNHAMSNDKGTSNAPDAVDVSISNGTTITNVANNLQWLFEKPSYGVYRFKVAGTSNYLYSTNTNNGVRVGNTNSPKDFEIKQDSNSNDFLYVTDLSRYLGVYSNQDWRTYTSIHDNIKATRVAFFKKTVVEGNKYDITINNSTPTYGEVTTSPSEHAYETNTVTINVSPNLGYKISTLTVKDASDNTVSVNGENKFTMPSSNVTITASFVENMTINMLKSEINNIAAAGTDSGSETGVYEFVNGATDDNVTVTCDGSIVTSAAKNNGGISFAVAENSGVARTGHIYVKYGDEAAHDIAVHQVAKTYTLEVAAADNGVVYATVGETNVAEGGTLTVACGTTVTVTVDPADGYELSSIVYNYGSGDSDITTGKTFTMPEGNTTITAEFVAEGSNPTITIADCSNGTVTTDPSGSVAEGTKVTITATPASGYSLMTLTVKDSSNANVAVDDKNQFTMPSSNVTITAVFAHKAVLSTTTFASAGITLTGTATTTAATTTIDGISVTYNGVSQSAKNTPQVSGASGDSQKPAAGQLVLLKKSGSGTLKNSSSLNLKKVIIEVTGTQHNSTTCNAPTVKYKASSDADYSTVSLSSPISSTRAFSPASGSTAISVNTFVYEVDMTGKNFFDVTTGSNQVNIYSVTIYY